MLPGAVALSLALLQAPADPEQIKEEFWRAARQGDVAAVKAMLAKGVDVNARFRYQTTALWHAAERGHLEVVRLLLENGADVNARDDLIGTPLMPAVFKGHTEIIKLLLDKGATGLDPALAVAVQIGRADVAGLLLAKGGFSAEALGSALAAATKDNRNEIADLLRKAGAKPIPKPEVRIDAEVLASYAGNYQSREGFEFSFTVKEGKLTGGNIFEDAGVWEALDQTTFRQAEASPFGPPPATISFNVENGKVTGFTYKGGGPGVTFQKAPNP
jgi:ankyrin repeat protein